MILSFHPKYIAHYRILQFFTHNTWDARIVACNSHKVCRQWMWNKVTGYEMPLSVSFTTHGVSILIQGNAIWYFRCCLGGVRGFLFTAGEHSSLSLIKQSGMTNKSVAVQLLPWVSQLFQGNKSRAFIPSTPKGINNTSLFSLFK